jgi:hypothetical protein
MVVAPRHFSAFGIAASLTPIISAAPLGTRYELVVCDSTVDTVAISPMNHAIDGCVGDGSDWASLESHVEALLSGLNPSVVLERRQNGRVAIPVLFQLTPLDDERHLLEHEAVVVLGKNISRCGISFFHELPISHRRAWIEIAQPGLAAFAAEIDVTWCRFTKPGWYESGGRLIRAVVPSGKSAASQQPRFETADLADSLGVSVPFAAT